jgi:magnesium transporter
MSSPAVRTRVWRNGVLEASDFPFENFSDYLAQEDCLVWADLCAPDATLLNQLAGELGLDPLSVEDASAQHERPKIMRYPSHVFLSTYALRLQPGSVGHEAALTHVSAFVLARAFVTVRMDGGFDIDDVVTRWDENKELIGQGAHALVYGLLDVIVDQYFDVVQVLDDEVEDLEDDLFDEDADVRAMQERAFRMRKTLVRVRRVIVPTRDVVETVMRRARDGTSGELLPYFEDLDDHVLRVAEWTESLRDLMSSIFDTNMALADTRLNQVMKKLTAWAAIVAVPTAITGYFGQNVPYPGFGTFWGFLLSVALIVGIGFMLYLVFKRKEWL